MAWWDEYARTAGLPSRSAVVQQAIRLLRQGDLDQDHAGGGIRGEDDDVMAVGRDGSNLRWVVLESVLTPATAVGVAFSAHHWQHQPWWAAVGAGVTIAAAIAAVRWWQFRAQAARVDPDRSR